MLGDRNTPEADQESVAVSPQPCLVSIFPLLQSSGESGIVNFGGFSQMMPNEIHM